MKIAIIGSKSYFGKNLCNFFFKKKIKLIKIKRTTNFNIKNNSFKSLDNVKNCNYLIYLAHDYSKNSSENNIRAIKKILKLKNYNKFRKIIYVSSMSAHVNNESNYGISKHKIENFCLMRNITVIKPGFIFGGINNYKIKKIIKLLNYLPIIPIYKNRKNYIYSVNINDLCNETFKILLNKKKIATKYNIFCNKKIFFDIFIKKITNQKKIYLKINYTFYLYIIKILNKFYFNKNIDSILSFMTSKKNYKLKEKNIYTSKSLF